MTRRSVPEWVGRTPDTPIPPRVRLRVFEAHNGVCALSGRKITVSDKWDVDHIQALALGGENRESNLQPVLRAEHRKKTAQDVADKSKGDRLRRKHLGIKASSRPLPGGRGSRWKKTINGEVVER